MKKTLILLITLVILSQTATSYQKVINFSLKDLYGKSYRLSDFKEKVILLNFFATWCPPCRAEIPSMIELKNFFSKNKNFEIIAISIDQADSKKIEQFVKSNKINFLVLHDKDGVVAKQYGVFSIPTTFIIDKKGNIIQKEIGYRDWMNDELVKSLLELSK